MKTGIRLLAFLLAALLLCGCSQAVPEQTLICKELTITLPATFLDFSEGSAASGLALNYAWQDVGVCATFENKAALQAATGELDAKRYAQLFLETNDMASQLQDRDGIPCFTYEADTVTYLCGVFESEENFWVVQAYCASNAFEANREDMWSYIQTVKVQ